MRFFSFFIPLLFASISLGVTYAGNSCPLIWSNQKLEDGKTVIGWTSLQGTASSPCSSATLTCNDGSLEGGKFTYTWPACYGSGGTDGTDSGGGGNLGTSCFNPLTNSAVPDTTRILGYSSATSSSTKTCNALAVELTCEKGTWIGGDGSTLFPLCTDLPKIPIDSLVKDCFFTGGINNETITLTNGSFATYYSEILWSQTGKNYSKSNCDMYSGTLSCINGALFGAPATYKYTFEECNNNEGKSCILPNKSSVENLYAWTGYSTALARYPKTCDGNYAAPLVCMNGNIVGNATLFKYDTCESTGGLVPGLDLKISAKLLGGTGIAQYSSPALLLTLTNRGTNLLSGSAKAGFIVCSWTGAGGNQTIPLYSSPALQSLVINPGTSLKKTVILKDILTQALGDKKITCSLTVPADLKEKNPENNTRSTAVSVIEAQRFDIAMSRSIDTIKEHLDAPEVALGTKGIQNLVFTKVMSVLVPLIIVLSILLAILGFYKLLFSSDEKALEEGAKYIIYGVIGILLIMSAKYIAFTFYSGLFNEGVLGYGSVQGYELAQKVYENIAYPFIKIAMYLVLGVLFVILASRVIGFVFGSDDDSKKKAGTIITWNIVGMLVIIGAKQVVEFVYGKQADVVKAVSNLGEIGKGLLSTKNLPILYQVINWAMGLASLVILIMVLVQAFQLMMQPDSADAMKKIKNSLIYIFIGILIIGAGYILTNFLIVN